MSNSSSYTFLKQFKIFPNIKTVCDRDTSCELCDITLDRYCVYETLPEKTMDMFKTVIEVMPDETVFLTYDDDVVVDYDYVLSVVERLEQSGHIYLGDPIACAGKASGKADAQCMNGKFYGVSRSVAECFAYMVQESDCVTPSEDVFFGSTVYNKCKYINYEYASGKIWHKNFEFKHSSCILLAYKGSSKKPVLDRCKA